MAKKQRKTKSGAELLKKAIGNRRGAQQQAALNAGMYPAQLSTIISGRRRPTLDQALAIDETLGVPPGVWKVNK